MPEDAFYDLESEQVLLAALMLEQKIYKLVDLSADDFYEKKHRKIYQAICEIAEEGLEPEYISVGEKIKAHGWEGEIPKLYLYDLLDKIPSPITAQWKNYVSIIKKKSATRKLNLLARQIEKDSKNGLSDLPGQIDRMIRQLVEIKEKAGGEHKSLSEQVREWVLVTSGEFMVTNCYQDLGVVTVSDKATVRQNLIRLTESGTLAKCGEKRGCYRLIEADSPSIDFLNADISQVYDLKFPFEIERYVHIYPKNIIVVAGASNSGKTAFLLNVVRLNMDQHKINYFSSEMGPEELKLRLLKFDDLRLKDWKFHPRERSTNFADAIVPDAVNIIDYLEVTKDFYEVGGEIKGIFDRLHKGLALIAIQKKTGADYGRGGEFTLEKPRLYISIDNHRIKIMKGKNWANPEINPNGLEWTFKLVNGCKFIETGGSLYDLD